MKKIERLTAIAGCLTFGAALMPVCGAYEASTHKLVTADAVLRTKVATDPTILSDIGLAPINTAVYQIPGGAPSRTPGASVPLNAAQTIVQGVEDEDYINFAEHHTRVFNHFYDVQYNGYVGRGLTQFGRTVGHASPDWALEDRGEVTTFELDLRNLGKEYYQSAGMNQNFSYRHAQLAYFELLTEREPATRLQRAMHMFRSLGMVVHHLQDMAQPQHARNERHDSRPNSFYEYYTEAYVNSRIQPFLANTYPIPQFDTARQFWYSVQSTNDRVPRYIGMAEFTSHNFVGLTTGYTATSSGQIIGSALPLPNGTNGDGTPKRIESRQLTMTYSNGISEVESGDFIIGKAFDALPIPAVSGSERLLAMSSLLDHGTRRFMSLRTFTVSPAVFEANYPILLPRASAFSTGLIDHFFRGRIDLRRNTSGSGWIVQNVSPRANQTMAGVVTLYYENQFGSRFPVLDGAFSVNLANGASNTLNVEPPSDARKLIAAFSGQIGNEAAGSGYFAIAGKIVDYSVPAVPCGTPISAGGGAAGMERTMDLGSTAGTIYGEFEAYGIPDKLVVRRSNSSGAILFTTSTLVPGYHTFNFPHPGGTDASLNRIHVKVTGNTEIPGTAWTTTIGCPGHQIGNPDRVQPRRFISFSHTPSGGASCPKGYYTVYLNGMNMGRLDYGHGVGSGTVGREVTVGPHQILLLVRTVTDNGQPTTGCLGGVPRMNDQDGHNIGSYVVGTQGYIDVH